MCKIRLDKACLDYVSTRSKAQDAIKEGRVFVNDVCITKASFQVDETDVIIVQPKEDDFVSRGGHKLKHALDTFHIDITDKVCLDIGASTGGFTDVCLRYGAKKVYALDVGHLQLDPSLDKDERVIKMEGFNARHIQSDTFDEPIDFLCMDVSFISCKTILEVVFKELQIQEFVILIKPQFECGPKFLNKHGVLKNEKIRNQVVEDVKSFLFSHYKSIQVIPSSIQGRSGNIEFLCYGKELR